MACGSQYLQTRRHTVCSVLRNSTKRRRQQRERSGGASGMPICIGDPYLQTRRHKVCSVFRNSTKRRRQQRERSGGANGMPICIVDPYLQKVRRCRPQYRPHAFVLRSLQTRRHTVCSVFRNSTKRRRQQSGHLVLYSCGPSWSKILSL